MSLLALEQKILRYLAENLPSDTISAGTAQSVIGCLSMQKIS
jgi:hypothetical protein